ncbi:methyltransferase domain-containing protein [Allosaccharopolyspora coralli]|uniref:Methyltransferase domain-containing protein n=1 Tax=Allosaccharopolyspora coralli TaxID=2665642 RepID=A0A5Q3QBS6_9PSEU|nr:class I SAM-dependent methyltransferase [Allosaccharopolyspora coralli]QGK70684.1 methyltransferase domain-containing protein [Allosaccharopolyspora coralli]
MPEDYFGEGVAELYDGFEQEMFDPAVVETTVEFLAPLADNGALELGVGTGRIALPLSERGVPVHGIDLSSAMLARLRAKPKADRISLTEGDFAHATVPRTFSLVYLVFNTIMNLTSQDEQVSCFRTVAAHLEPGGRFVVEVGVPDLQRLPFGETVRPFSVSPDRLGFDEYELATQRLVSHHYRTVNGELTVRSIPFRFVWPSELDLMARLAGLRLCQRWGGWNREPFTAASGSHVSVWEKPSAQ